MNKIFLIFLITSPLWTFGQGVLKLEDCQKIAAANYPLMKNQAINDQSLQLATNSLKANFLPQLSMNGQASWQSDVTTIPIKIPGINIPEASKDQYKLSIDVNQLIYDGGYNSLAKEAAIVQNRIEQNDLDNEIYKLRQRINDLYFNSNLLKHQIEILENSKKSLQARLKVCESAVINGTITHGQCDLIQAELLGIDQKITEARTGIEATANMLSIYTGTTIHSETILEIPESEIIPGNFEIRRPDYNAFSLNSTKTEILQKQSKTRLLPRLAGFAQAGYGRPGFNMLQNEFADFFMIGAKFNWTIWNWKQTSNDSKIAGLKKELIMNTRLTFETNLRLQLASRLAEIGKYKELLNSDNQIITTRERISREAASQFDNGVLQSADLIQRMNEESTARLNAEIHKLQYKYSKLTYNELLGKN